MSCFSEQLHIHCSRATLGQLSSYYSALSIESSYQSLMKPMENLFSRRGLQHRWEAPFWSADWVFLPLPSSCKICSSETENLSAPNAYIGSFTKKTKYIILLNLALFLRLLVCHLSFWRLNNSCSNMKRLQKSTSHWNQRGYPMVLLCSLFHICLMKSSAFLK